MTAMRESATTLKRLAESGGFAVDDSTGNQMIESLEGVIDTLQSRWDALQKVGQTPLMSETATGKWVANHMVNTASDQQGLLTQLQAAKQEFPTYIEAIKLAKQNYRESDTTSHTTLRRVPNEQA
ncbi:MAG TPA: hypothetical protein VG674_09035 [Amycolatopsis sp.]|nr:hypothetical protein [Amycolatopsis sp.]